MSTAIAQQKIRIRLKAFDRRMLDLSCDKIIETADQTAATAIGPIPLPTKRKIYCVLRSPRLFRLSYASIGLLGVGSLGMSGTLSKTQDRQDSAER